MSFGTNLKRIRESLGMTARELSRRAKLTPSAISLIEAGKREPGLSTILAILKVIPATFDKLTEEK